MVKRKTPVAGYPIMDAEEERRRRRVEDVEPFDEEEITSPIDLIDIKKYQSDSSYRQDWDEVTRQFNENAAYRILWARFGRLKHGMDTVPPPLSTADDPTHSRLEELEKELQSISTVLKITKWILGMVIAATLGSVTVAFAKVFSWGVDSGEMQIRVDHLEKEVMHLERSSHP